MGLIFTANIVIADLVKKADVIFITFNIVLETCIYSISTARVVFYNKVRKVFKLNSFAKFA